MLYTWKDENTGKVVEVERSMKDSDILPYLQECQRQGLTLQEFTSADWRKIVLGGSFSRGFGEKGRW
jgi:hypothetical protein